MVNIRNLLRVGTFEQSLSDIGIFSRLPDFEKMAVSSDSFLNSPRQVNLNNIFVELSKRFHVSAGTYTESVIAALNRLSSGAPVIRLFHQPNTLMGLNVLGLTDISRHLQHNHSLSSLKPVTLFLLLDYDSANDKRFISPTFPILSKLGPVYLKGVVPNRIRNRIACAVPQPPEHVAVNWLNQLIESAKFWSSAISRSGAPIFSKAQIDERGAFIIAQLKESFTSSSSLTEVNSFVISKFINTILNYDILFIPASWLLEYSYPNILEILCMDDDIIGQLNTVIKQEYKQFGLELDLIDCNFKQKGAWRICHQCFKRRPMRVEGVNVTNLVGSWECPQCGIKATECLSDYQVVQGPFGEIPKVIPSVIICDLLEVLSYELMVGCHYAGGLEHLIRSKFVRKAIGQPLATDFIWDPNTLFTDKCNIDQISNLDSDYTCGLDCWNKSFRCGKFPAIFYWLLLDYNYISNGIYTSVC